MTFSKKIKFVRTELLMTQTQLAKELGVTQETVARWESGARNPQLVQIGKFKKICEKYIIKFDN